MEISYSDLVVGEVVRARGQVWTVDDIRRYDECEELRLSRSGGRGMHTCTLLFPFDRPVRLSRRSRVQVVSARATRHCLADAVWSSRAWNAFHRLPSADVELLPFQMEPALALLVGLSTRLLLADDVGLGKTIQAGVALVELAARGWARRVLILTPAGLRDQWTGELGRRFRVDATPVDAAHLASAVAGAPRGVNPWALDGIYVVSYDFVKRSEVVRSLDALPWDLVIVDEAHAVAGPSDRHRAVHGLCRRARRVVLLTATPHTGHDAGFEALCALGDGPGCQPREPIIVFRRTREEIGLRRRRRVTALRVTPSADERRMHALLGRYARAVRREVGAVGGARLAMIVLRKRALSSAASLARSVDRRLQLLASATGRPDLRQLELPLDADGETQTEDEVPDEVLAVPGMADRAREEAWLRAIADAARAAAHDERKLAALRRLVRRTRSSVIVFTEYRDTLDRIAAEVGSLASLATLHGGLTRRERAAALARFDDGRARVLLATDTAGEGLNLQRRCRSVVSFELPWTPARIEQRIGRVDRLGQTARVHALLLVARDTAELTVIARLIARERRVHRTLGGGGLSPVPEDAVAAIAPAAAREHAPRSAPPPQRIPAADRRFVVAPSWLRRAAAAEAARVGLERRLARLGCPGGGVPTFDAGMPGDLPVGFVVSKTRRPRHRTPPVSAGVVLVYRGVLEDREGRVVDSSLVPMHVRTSLIPRRLARLAVRQLVGDVLLSHRRALQDLVSRTMRRRLVSVTRRYRQSVAAAVRRERWLARATTESLARTLVQPGLFDRRAVASAELDRRARERRLAESQAHLRSLEAGKALRIGPVELALAIVLAGTTGPS